MKTISVREFAAVKRVAQNVYALYNRKARLEKAAQKIQEEYEEVKKSIKLNEAGVVDLTGYSTDLLVCREKLAHGGVRYVPNPVNVVYNENESVYEINVTSDATVDTSTDDE